jgi:hypothetical protein
LIKKLFRKGSASALALTLGLSSLTIGLVSSSAEAKGKDSYSFAACVADKRSANVLIMMDESGSVYQSDPDGLRVEGAEVLIDRIQRVADVYESPVNVMLAGFGDNFEDRSGGWVALKPKETAGVSALAKTARKFTKKTPNKRETDMLSSLNGATEALAAATPADSCKLFIFFKDGVDFQKFIEDKPTEFVGDEYKDVFELLKEAKYEDADSLAEEEICRRGGLADALRGEDNLYTFGVALNPDATTKGGLDKFKSLVEGGNSCGDLPAKGTFFEVNKSSDLPALFGRALDPNFIPRDRPGKFDIEMKRALTSVNILSSGIPSTFGSFTLTLPPTCSVSSPIEIPRSQRTFEKTIGNSVNLSAKWAGSSPSESQTLSISVKHTNLSDDTCWEGKWTIDPGSDAAKSWLTLDADLSASAKFETAPVLRRDSNSAASEFFSLEIIRPSDKTVVKPADFDKDLEFSITGFLRDAGTKEVVASSWDGYVVTKSNIGSVQTLSVESAALGDYELVLTMEVDVAGFSEKLMPVTTQQAIKISTPYAAPTISGVTEFKDIDGANRKRGSVTFVGSPDADFEISIASKDTKVNATRFPKNLDYEMFLPAGVSDNITIPKGQTVTIDVEIAVKLAEGSSGVNAQGPVSGDLIFAGTAKGVNQDASKVEGKFTATQLADANLISQLLWTIFFMAIGLALPLAALLVITVLLSRFPKPSESLPQGAAFTVQYSNGQVTNAAELTQQAGDLRNFPFVDVAQDRKSATVGFNTFKVKVNPFGMKSVSHAELENSSSVGANSTGDGKPYMSINLVSEWIFIADTGAMDLFADAASGSGTVVLVVSLAYGAPTGPELMADFLRNSSKILGDLPKRSTAGILGGDSSGFDFGTGSQKSSGNNGNDGFVGI